MDLLYKIFVITEALMSVDIVAIACGVQHVAALSMQGNVFTWGQEDDGRLGHGKEESRWEVNFMFFYVMLTIDLTQFRTKRD
jgi:alpha-tubulin suppressor-like RCC1 family protein